LGNIQAGFHDVIEVDVADPASQLENKRTMMMDLPTRQNSRSVPGFLTRGSAEQQLPLRCTSPDVLAANGLRGARKKNAVTTATNNSLADFYLSCAHHAAFTNCFYRFLLFLLCF